MAEWTSNDDYLIRANNLLNGTGATNGVKLKAAVLDDDQSIDSIKAGNGRDMFFAGSNDTFSAPNLPQSNEKFIFV